MQVTPIRTTKITADSGTLLSVLDAALPQLLDGSIVVITSKIVSICEGSTVPVDRMSKPELVAQVADRHIPGDAHPHGSHFTLVDDLLTTAAGIDLSNGDGQYVLLPRDAQQTANDVRSHLKQAHGITRLGVVIVDSISRPSRRGATGIAMAHSGFLALDSYVGREDLFGRHMHVSTANVSGGLAAAAVLVMGEGSEQTPLAVITDYNAQFQDRNPNEAELAELRIPIEEDLYAPILRNDLWQPGGSRKHLP